MTAEVTLATIISNAFNKDYTADQSADDLTRLMNQVTLLELRQNQVKRTQAQ